jgi:hypothetical protein
VGALPASGGCDQTTHGRYGLYIGSTSAPINCFECLLRTYLDAILREVPAS